MELQSNLLDRKVSFVTGASRGIGRAIVEEFAKNGSIIYANSLTEGSLAGLTEYIFKKYGVQVTPLYFDVRDSQSAKKAIIQIHKEQGKLDILVNNAGIMKDALIGMITKQLMEDTFSVNVFAVMELLQLASKLMIRQKSGSIINIASIVGVNGNMGQLVYSASKGAVISLTKTASKELAPKNIRVNAIAPGMIDTDMFQSIGREHVEKRLSNIGMGRLGTPEDVAKTCVYLASDLSSYVTGQIIGVDGSALV
ncbi:glucose 1-dehydrogenase [Paenibacillus qinlingensis]|uniref:3-oxoacyl-[acyl-carrier protein] reductase n=1 Tax=Paenibacillus qinlingensis TaxID=1837343 RepID=A0ABU1P2L7_9BACL|nr:glucose 1-dehydrogenase [Paenibacillus qinlingensis]MDR6553596.1 3-oxoacyl-[acyl-carrier protein] reductase [Paenibacillus qinlingensis]